MHCAFIPQLVGPQTGAQRLPTHAALLAQSSSLTHSGVGGGGVDMTRSHLTNGEPLYPAGHEHTAACRTPAHIAFNPQALMQGSTHLRLMQERSPGQSSLTIHSGYEQKPSRHVP